MGQGMCSEFKPHQMLRRRQKRCLRGRQGLRKHTALQSQG